MNNSQTPNSGRKLFFGLFVFPLLIAVGMAVLLCSVVLLTNEKETPDALIAAIKTGSQSKRWQKAFELSNELNRQKGSLRNSALMQEIIYVLADTSHYDPKTRAYMAMALAHFKEPEATDALRKILNDPEEDVQLYAIWSLGTMQAKDALPDLLPFLKSEKESLRKMAAYVLGVVGNKQTLESLRPLLDDKAADVRWNAALSLARLGDNAGLPVILQMLERNTLAANYGMNDEQIEKVMINAIKGLALIGKPEPIKILASISKNDKSLKVRQAAIEAMQFYERN